MGRKKAHSEEFEEQREHIHRQMLSAVSHDLKTPLATMIGTLEIYTRMEERLTPEKKAALISSALGEAYRLDNFITNILDMAKLEGGMVKLRQEPADLRALVRDCLTRLGPRGKSENITLRQTNEGTTITTDPVLLGRAIGLIVDNALKHAGKQANIEIAYGCEGSNAVIAVSDNGPGIPAGKEEEIFCKYTRFSKNDQQNAGTGLGLAITRQMMQLLGGNVRVSNLPEGGARFTLTCPAACV